MEQPLSLFISYSHADEEYVEELKKHLVTLKREGVISVWHDRELTTGDEFDEEIKSELVKADLVAFIVSVDFLNSWYCYEVELKESLNRLEQGEIRIIPIIVRECKWKDTVLSKYLAATKDGKPIKKYNDTDEAWTEVANSIEKAAKKYSSEKAKPPAEENPSIKEICKEFYWELQDTEVVFRNKYKERITLDDIYIFPDLKNIKLEYDEIDKTINAEEVLNTTHKKTAILGAEQSGKTSLGKTLFKEFHKNEHIPLLCNAEIINSTDITKLIKSIIHEQYSNISFDEFRRNKEKNILIIDDFDKLKINTRHQDKLISNILESFEKIVLISNTSIRFDESKFIKISDFNQFEILPFGNLRRGELIEKWNSIGREETIDIKELHDENDRVTRHVNSIILRNILPRKPIYILTIIQLLETSKPSDYSLTSYGHCYQSLIQRNLEKENIKSRDFDLYINYLTELAYFIFTTQSDSISDTELSKFKKQYSEKYLIDSHDKTISTLSRSGILNDRNQLLSFGYRYIYYFYVAKYLSDHLDLHNCKKYIENLCKNLHTEKNANILIFLVHHSKDEKIIDEILAQSSVVFDGVEEAKLDPIETKYLLEYIASIPKLVIEQRDIDKERRKRLETQDLIEEVENGADIETDEADEISDESILSEINRSARIVEITGQIMRNRFGSLTKGQLKDLCYTAYSSGLKFLNFFLKTTRDEQEYLLDFIQDIFITNTDLDDESIAKEARNIFLMFCYGTSFSVIKKIANSVGSSKLLPIFDEINSELVQTPASRLIHLAIKLEFTKSIPKAELSALYNDLEGNPIAQRLLQELVIQHLYLNHVDFQDRQWISSKIHLPIKSQRLLQDKSHFKK